MTNAKLMTTLRIPALVAVLLAGVVAIGCTLAGVDRTELVLTLVCWPSLAAVVTALGMEVWR